MVSLARWYLSIAQVICPCKRSDFSLAFFKCLILHRPMILRLPWSQSSPGIRSLVFYNTFFILILLLSLFHPMSSTADENSSLPSDEWMETFDFSAYLNDYLPDDQDSTVDTRFSVNSMPLIPGGTWPGSVESPVYLNHSLLSVQPINSTMINFPNSACLKKKLSEIRLRTKKACNQCRKKKTRCNRKGEEECVPSSKARKSACRQSARRKVQLSTSIAPSIGPQVNQLELPDVRCTSDLGYAASITNELSGSR